MCFDKKKRGSPSATVRAGSRRYCPPPTSSPSAPSSSHPSRGYLSPDTELSPISRPWRYFLPERALEPPPPLLSTHRRRFSPDRRSAAGRRLDAVASPQIDAVTASPRIDAPPVPGTASPSLLVCSFFSSKPQSIHRSFLIVRRLISVHCHAYILNAFCSFL